jgi:hypothetical protein
MTVESPRVQEVWRLGTPRIDVLSGPDAASTAAADRLGYSIAVGEQVGRCFIRRAEALGLHQLTSGWIERALVNIVLRHGSGEVIARMRSEDGLEIHVDDAADIAAPDGLPDVVGDG